MLVHVATQLCKGSVDQVRSYCGGTGQDFGFHNIQRFFLPRDQICFAAAEASPNHIKSLLQRESRQFALQEYFAFGFDVLIQVRCHHLVSQFVASNATRKVCFH